MLNSNHTNMPNRDAPGKPDKSSGAASSSVRRPDRRQQQGSSSSSSSARQAPEQSHDSFGALATRVTTACNQYLPQAPATGSAGLQPHHPPAPKGEEDRKTRRSATLSPRERSRDLAGGSAGSHPPGSASARGDRRTPASVAVPARQKTTDPPPREKHATSSGTQKKSHLPPTGAISHAPPTDLAQTQVSRLRGGGESSTSRGSLQEHSVSARGFEFRPPSPLSQMLPQSRGDSGSRSTRPLPSKMGIGIETEFLLAPRRQGPQSELNGFAAELVCGHNRGVHRQHPQMRNDLTVFASKQPFDQWSLVEDATMLTEDSPWGIEIKTPLLVASPGSQWRSHVEATWKYLQESYHITDNRNCGTHVHVSVEGGYSLEDVKRLAQSAVYFEPAFEVLVPYYRRSDFVWTKSSWLESPKLAASNLSRAECIERIDQTPDFMMLADLMGPLAEGGYSWNLRSIHHFYSIEFRKPPASKTVEEALGWAELAMNFVQASLRYGSPERLQKVPQTIGGLRWFLNQSQIDGLNQPARLRPIFEHKHPSAFLHVIPKGTILNDAQKATVRKMIEADKILIQKRIKTLSEPYWW